MQRRRLGVRCSVVAAALRRVPGVMEAGELRMRWLGHRLRAEVAIVVDGGLSVRAAHRVAVDAEHALLHVVKQS